ncbi:MAG: SDR family NAD(P)-dependent oxidoreductase [Clostridia bacterium]|nr:SDR family NAD(P)-dependent oxidoreductase [Clostridia bacterium]
MSLTLLREMSNKYGANPEYVLAGGGNTSYKDDETLYIKGSGVSLAEITEDGFVKIDRSKLTEIYSKTYSEDSDTREAEVLADMMAARRAGEEHKRPSVETLLHDVFDYSFILHLHPSRINGLTCAKDWKSAFDKYFAVNSVWIRPIMPGYILAMEVKEKVDSFKAANGKLPLFIFLENHGVFIGGNSLAEIDVNVKILNDVLDETVKMVPDFSACEFDADKAAAIAPAIRAMLADEEGAMGIVTFKTNKEFANVVASEANFAEASTAFSPDHMVYCYDRRIFIEAEELEDIYAELAAKIDAFRKEVGKDPKIIAVKNLGVFAAGRSKKEADIAAEVFTDAVKVSVYAKNFGGSKPLPEDLIYAINNWEVERYRKKVSLAAGGVKRLGGKISIVTGSAQGFGKGVADMMAKEGSYMTYADLNGEGAIKASEAVNAELGKGASIAVKVNVGNEEDVKNMMNATVLAYGGLDVFVSNAGIVRAGTLDEMTKENFELSTLINYTAYFLGTKYAQKVMKIQNRFNGKEYFDIIQINSKSGLEGSNKNFAYAGSKFGGIGLTQSFALELCPYNIKVNSVCPGNFLDGPLWSDPEKGLFVQYLKAGKVPGAKTVEDVKKAYEAKVPMNTGCHEIDVARAIYYCIEQKYETGQAIPVTGGQIMLK